MTRLILALLLIATPALAADFTCRSPGLIDGDTFVCDGRRVRLWGVDAPERHTPAGPAATRALADLTTGQTVTCRPRGGKSWGRTNAQCFVGGRDIAAEMVRQGHAADWPKYSKGFYARFVP